MNLYFRFLDWFYSSWLGTAFYWYKIFAAAASFLLLAVIIYIVYLMYQLNKPSPKTIEEAIEEDFGKIPESAKTDLSPRWQEILDKVSSPNPSEWKLAVIEADSLLDDLLKRIGYPGETMGERLKFVDSSKITSINGLWEAHKIRNMIAHEPDHPVSRQEIEKAIEGFEKVLDELEFI